MKLRVLSAIVGIPILFAILYFTPLWCILIANTLISVCGVYEILNASGVAPKRTPERLLSLVVATFITIFSFFEMKYGLAAVIFIFIISLFALGFKNIHRMTFEKICICFFAATVIPVCLSGIARLAAGTSGMYFVIFPFIIAWSCDTGAFFFGKFLGKRKLCPHLSPKKTVVGAIGGCISAVAGTLIMCGIFQMFFHKTPDYLIFGSFAFGASILAQFGDLSMSFIKRNYGVKDYGSIMPGHGGILDRFDSVIFVTPVVEALVLFLPNILL